MLSSMPKNILLYEANIQQVCPMQIIKSAWIKTLVPVLTHNRNPSIMHFHLSKIYSSTIKQINQELSSNMRQDDLWFTVDTS